MRRWSEYIIQFVELYEHNECLWNFSPDYKKDARQKALHNIVQELNIPGAGTPEILNKLKQSEVLNKK